MWRRALPRWVYLLHCVMVWRIGRRHDTDAHGLHG